MNELRQREPHLALPKLLVAVRQLPCTLRIPNVCIDRDVCAAHSNEDDHGKGKGLKAHDCFIAAACPPCHDHIDRRRDPERWEIMRRARDRTLYLLFKNRLLQVR